MVTKLIRYGSLSDRQWVYIGRLRAQILSPVAAAPEGSPQPIPDAVCNGATVRITGEIVSVKRKDDRFARSGTVLKMLVKHTDGWKVWGTLPQSLTMNDQGATVTFLASVQRSANDDKFGFFKYPTQARVVPAGTVVTDEEPAPAAADTADEEIPF
jgi:hypothetical protein